jgi:hypothetical protein
MRKLLFWNSREGPPEAVIKLLDTVLRPTLIIRYYLKRLSRQDSNTIEKAREEFAKDTGIPQHDILRIEGGEIPTSSQLQRIIDAYGWSIFFLLGISEVAYQEKETVFFDRMGVRNPTPGERKAFLDLYARLLAQRFDDPRLREGGGNAEST